jgi:hypothetical protein
MKYLFIAFLLVSISPASYSQIAHDFMLSTGLDLIKTDNDGVLEKAQTGFEVNYFITRKVSGTAGAEIWSDQKDSFVIGGRCYLSNKLFLRVRGLIGENDLSLGAGYSKLLNSNWRTDFLGDFYFKGEFSLRIGVSYLIKK